MTSTDLNYRRLASWLLAVFLTASVTSLSFGQHRPSAPRRPTPFARYVPASANLFITVRQLSKVDAAVRRSHARQLVPLITADGLDQGRPFDLRTAVARFLGKAHAINTEELMKAEVAVVADSWTELGGAVWLVRAPDEAALDRWFPKEQRTGGGKGRTVRSFRTRDGLRVFVRDDIVAMARRGGVGSLLGETGRLMIGRGGVALEQSDAYQELVAYLPGRPLAVAYVARDKSSSAGESDGGWLWPALDRAIVGMYERDGRMDFAIHGRRSEPRKGIPVSLDAFGRLVRLPRATLAASAMTVDFAGAAAAADPNSSLGILGRYLNLLVGFGSRSATPAELFGRLGPHVILAWDQDLSGSGKPPQVAVMVECDDARGVRDELTHIADNIIKLTRSSDRVDGGSTPAIQQSSHLGTPVMHISLEAHARQPRSPATALLEGVEPAWAAWGHWVVIALSRDHITRIIDAQYGFAPTLASLHDVQEINYYRANRTGLSFIQAKLASAVLDRWLKAFEDGAPSLLDPTSWDTPDSADSIVRAQLGIEPRPNGQPGVVVVARVLPDAPAMGFLQDGDRIIGIDGELLRLQAPNIDLSARLRKSEAKPGPTLRVQRGDAMLNVTLPSAGPPSTAPGRSVTPLQAVRELASLGRTLQFATFSVHATRDSHYSAQLSLRFAPAGTAQAD